jgi:hypothetical protein
MAREGKITSLGDDFFLLTSGADGGEHRSVRSARTGTWRNEPVSNSASMSFL